MYNLLRLSTKIKMFDISNLKSNKTTYNKKTVKTLLLICK